MTTDTKAEEQIIGRELLLLVVSSNKNIRRVLASKASIDEPFGSITILPYVSEKHNQHLLQVIGDTAQIDRLLLFFEKSEEIEILDINRSPRITIAFPKS